nr:MAG TPA_asm: hypothetical protein [Caudoviricetes sp.]
MLIFRPSEGIPAFDSSLLKFANANLNFSMFISDILGLPM